MKTDLQSLACFIALCSVVFGDDFNPRSSMPEKTKTGLVMAKVVLVGNDEPWLEILVPIVESDRSGSKTFIDQNKVVRVPIHRAVAWNANGDRLRDELITETFLEATSLYVNGLLVQSKRLTPKKIYVNKSMQFGRFEEYRKFQRDGVRDFRLEMKTPPKGSFDTGEYFVFFDNPAGPEKRTNSIWLFLPPELFE